MQYKLSVIEHRIDLYLKVSMGPNEYYNTKKAALEQALEFNSGKLNQMIWLRLVCFVLLTISIYGSIQFHVAFSILSVFFCALFLWLVKLNLGLSKKQKSLEKGLWIITQELKAIHGGQTDWYDGSRFVQKGSVGFDLDVFGSFSLFHALNRCSTKRGEQQLATILAAGKTTELSIDHRQETVRELSHQNEFRLQWQIAAGLMEEKKEEHLLLTAPEEKFITFNGWPLLIGVLTAGSLSALIYAYFTGNFSFLTFMVCTNLSLVGRYLRIINKKHVQVSGANTVLNSYKELIQLYNSVQWQGKVNLNHSMALQNADKAIGELQRISERFDRRMNILIAIVFNGIWLNDIVQCWQLEKWNKKYLAQLPQWLEVLYHIEAWQSLGTYAFNTVETHIYPKTTRENKLTFEELAHPLMPKNKRVANSYTMENTERVCLITGSNMSGKSTFLRTIGVNLIMAQTGLPVCAKRFEFKPMHICTSLRQTDSLEDNVSLFHAELLKLKAIREQVRQNDLTLVLLDEMLRGTNSEDKLYGSRKLIEELLNENIIGFIATHDLALGELEDKYPGRIKNACFESVIEEGELKFDYTLKRGVARNKNATFLLHKMGIIKD